MGFFRHRQPKPSTDFLLEEREDAATAAGFAALGTATRATCPFVDPFLAEAWWRGFRWAEQLEASSW